MKTRFGPSISGCDALTSYCVVQGNSHSRSPRPAVSPTSRDAVKARIWRRRRASRASERSRRPGRRVRSRRACRSRGRRRRPNCRCGRPAARRRCRPRSAATADMPHWMLLGAGVFEDVRPPERPSIRFVERAQLAGRTEDVQTRPSCHVGVARGPSPPISFAECGRPRAGPELAAGCEVVGCRHFLRTALLDRECASFGNQQTTHSLRRSAASRPASSRLPASSTAPPLPRTRRHGAVRESRSSRARCLRVRTDLARV